MKKLIVIAALPLLLTSSFVIGQIKNDNTIIIHTTNTDSTNFASFGRHLVQNNHPLKSYDKDFLMMTTERHTSEGFDYVLNINFTDSTIVIRPVTYAMSLGAFMAGDVEEIATEWSYAKSKGNYNKRAYNEFFPVIHAYSSNITFEKR